MRVKKLTHGTYRRTCFRRRNTNVLLALALFSALFGLRKYGGGSLNLRPSDLFSGNARTQPLSGESGGGGGGGAERFWSWDKSGAGSSNSRKSGGESANGDAAASGNSSNDGGMSDVLSDASLTNDPAGTASSGPRVVFADDPCESSSSSSPSLASQDDDGKGSIIFVPVRGVEAAVVQNILHRQALAAGKTARVLLPLHASDLTYSAATPVPILCNNGDISKSGNGGGYANSATGGGGEGDGRPFFAVSAYFDSLNPLALRRRFPKATVVAVIAEPSRLAQSSLQLPLLAGASYSWTSATRNYNFKAGNKNKNDRSGTGTATTTTAAKHATTSQVTGLGLPATPFDGDVGATVASAEKVFDLLLVAEHMDESLIALQQYMGWPVEAVVHCPQLGEHTERIHLQRGSRWGPSGRSFYHQDRADKALYRAAKARLTRAQARKGFAAALAKLRALKKRRATQCNKYSLYGQVEVMATLMDRSVPAYERALALQRAEASTMVELLQVMGGRDYSSNHIVRGRDQHYSKSISQNDLAKVRQRQAPGAKKGERPVPLVWIKTHKTGSSTMTNVFHRIVTRLGHRVAVPKDNLFIGWPREGTMLRSVMPYHGSPFNFEALGSGHSRYNRPLMEQIVPGSDAAYITLLREPVSHIKSSWRYWGIQQHIKGKFSKDITLDQYLSNPAGNQKYATGSDLYLLHNSQAYDLGLGVDDPVSAVERLIEHMDAHFALVLITEYFDESLVLLKRRLSLRMSDIVYFRLKVNKKPHMVPAVDHLAPSILQYNRLDAMLYAHFNASLWKQIEREEGFHEEVAAMRQQQEQWTTTCTSWLKLKENEHRKVLVEDRVGRERLDETRRRCHEMLMDSGGFAKYLKFTSGLSVRECHTQYWARIVFILVRGYGGPGTDTIGSLLQIKALRRALNVAMPRGSSARTHHRLERPNHYYAEDPLMEVGTKQTPLLSVYRRGVPVKQAPSVIASGRLMWNEDILAKTIHQGKYRGRYIMVHEDPVAAFVRTWTKLGVAGQVFGARPPTNAIEIFFSSNFTGHWAKLDLRTQRRLLNPQSRVVGAPQEQPFAKEATFFPKVRQQLAKAVFAAHIVSERLLESLVLLHREMCWNGDDLLVAASTLQRVASHPTVSDAAAASIRRFNRADVALYQMAVSWHETHIKDEVAFPESLKTLRHAISAWGRACKRYPIANSGDQKSILDRFRKMQDSRLNSVMDEKRCLMLAMDEKSAGTLLLEPWKLYLPPPDPVEVIPLPRVLT